MPYAFTFNFPCLEVDDPPKIAGRYTYTMDAGKDIDDIKRLKRLGKELYNKDSKTEDWKKRTGIARVTNGKEEQTIVVHWYECANIGKLEFKEKPPKEIEWE